LFCLVNEITGKHPVSPALNVSLSRQLQKRRHRFPGNEVLGVIQQQSGQFNRELAETRVILAEQLRNMGLRVIASSLVIVCYPWWDLGFLRLNCSLWVAMKFNKDIRRI
jgi:hypothetical protein